MKKHSSLLLSILGSIGVISTAIMAVKATPKALELIEERKKEEKCDELEPIEAIKTTWKCYIPSAIVGVATISCVIGSYILNKKRQTMLLNSYILLDQYFKEYKRSVQKLYGDNADVKVMSEIAKQEHDPEKCLFFLEPYGQYFEHKMEDVILAEYNLNKKFVTKKEASLNDFLKFLGLEETKTDDDSGYVGWTQEIICDFCNPEWIDFEHKLINLEDGMECYIINASIEPRFIFNDFPPDYLPF